MQTGVKPMDELLTLRPQDRVRVLLDDHTEEDYEVRSEPWQLGHGGWVIGLKGMAGGYALSRVIKVLYRANVVVCVLCRRVNPNPQSSACPTCIPPDEGEIRLQGTVAALRAEVKMLQESCEEHIRIRNDQGEKLERIAELVPVRMTEMMANLEVAEQQELCMILHGVKNSYSVG